MSIAFSKDDLPAELIAIQEYRSNEIREIDKECLKRLDALKKKFMRNGDLDSANQVDAMIKELSPQGVFKNSTTKWRWATGGELVLQKDGVATHTSWNRPGSWELNEDETITLKSEMGTFTIKFNEHGDGVVTHISGSRTAITRK
jgi:hypothetical protein